MPICLLIEGTSGFFPPVRWPSHDRLFCRLTPKILQILLSKICLSCQSVPIRSRTVSSGGMPRNFARFCLVMNSVRVVLDWFTSRPFESRNWTILRECVLYVDLIEHPAITANQILRIIRVHCQCATIQTVFTEEFRTREMCRWGTIVVFQGLPWIRWRTQGTGVAPERILAGLHTIVTE